MNQLGDYYSTTEGGTVSRPAPGGSFQPTRVGTGQLFAPPAPLRATGASPDGIGSALGDVLSFSPLVRDVRRIKNRGRMSGVGQQDSPEAPTVIEPAVPAGWLVAAMLLGVVVRGAAGYFVGKAVAPSEQAEGKYAWWGVPTAILFGTLGMGVEAGIALSKR